MYTFHCFLSDPIFYVSVSKSYFAVSENTYIIDSESEIKICILSYRHTAFKKSFKQHMIFYIYVYNEVMYLNFSRKYFSMSLPLFVYQSYLQL